MGLAPAYHWTRRRRPARVWSEEACRGHRTARRRGPGRGQAPAGAAGRSASSAVATLLGTGPFTTAPEVKPGAEQPTVKLSRGPAGRRFSQIPGATCPLARARAPLPGRGGTRGGRPTYVSTSCCCPPADALSDSSTPAGDGRSCFGRGCSAACCWVEGSASARYAGTRRRACGSRAASLVGLRPEEQELRWRPWEDPHSGQTTSCAPPRRVLSGRERPSLAASTAAGSKTTCGRQTPRRRASRWEIVQLSNQRSRSCWLAHMALLSLSEGQGQEPRNVLRAVDLSAPLTPRSAGKHPRVEWQERARPDAAASHPAHRVIAGRD